MPLDARKSLHLLQIVARSFSGRQRTVVIVYQASGSYSYSAVQVIMRPQRVVDPQVYNPGGQAEPRNFDTVMIAPISLNVSGIIYVADTVTATAAAVAAAPKYEIVEILPAGLIPGGSHWRISLRRLR